MQRRFLSPVPRALLLATALLFGAVGLVACGDPAPDPVEPEWQRAEESDTPAGYEAFASRHPEHPKARLARQRSEEIRREQLLRCDYRVEVPLAGLSVVQVRDELRLLCAALEQALPALEAREATAHSGLGLVDLKLRAGGEDPGLGALRAQLAGAAWPREARAAIHPDAGRPSFWIRRDGSGDAAGTSEAAARLRQRVQRIPHVEEIETSGLAGIPVTVVEVDGKALAAMGVRPAELERALRSLDRLPGDPEALENLVLRATPNGQLVRLRDVARILREERPQPGALRQLPPKTVIARVWPMRGHADSVQRELRKLVAEEARSGGAFEGVSATVFKERGDTLLFAGGSGRSSLPEVPSTWSRLFDRSGVVRVRATEHRRIDQELEPQIAARWLGRRCDHGEGRGRSFVVVASGGDEAGRVQALSALRRACAEPKPRLLVLGGADATHEPVVVRRVLPERARDTGLDRIALRELRRRAVSSQSFFDGRLRLDVADTEAIAALDAVTRMVTREEPRTLQLWRGRDARWVEVVAQEAESGDPADALGRLVSALELPTGVRLELIAPR